MRALPCFGDPGETPESREQGRDRKLELVCRASRSAAGHISAILMPSYDLFPNPAGDGCLVDFQAIC
nr:hypothetical protein [uncultured Ruegeria sp.]